MHRQHSKAFFARTVATLALVAAGACLPEDPDAPPPPRVDAGPQEDAGPQLPLGLHALDTLEPTAPTTDLRPFFDATAEASVIGLGEAVHTSGGFYALKDRLIRALIQEQGVRVFVIETPRAYAAPLDTYVATPGCQHQGAINATRGSVFAVFVDDNFIDLLVAICQFNQQQSQGGRVRIYGTDAQQPEADRDAIETFLRAHAAADADTLLSGLATCLTDPAVLEFPSTSAYTSCTEGLAALEGYVEQHRATLQQAGSAFRFFEVDLQSFASWQDEIFFYYSDTARSYEARDKAMGQAFLVMQELLFPDERAVLWAHDYHLAAAHDRALNNFPPGAVTLGTVLKNALGPLYLPYAITAREIEINWPNVTGGPRPSGGVEDELAELGHDLLFVDASAEIMQRNVESTLGYMVLDLQDNFAGFFYLDSSPGMQAVYW